jgi:glycosyltransferase involved in cell wall biosynthesis
VPDSVRHDIVLLQWQGTGGGAERHVLDLAASLTVLGNRLAVVYFASPGGTETRLRRDGVTVRTLGLSSGLDPRGPVRLSRVLEDLRPRLIHDHLSTPWTRALLRASCPVIATEHGNLSLYRYERRRLRRAIERRGARRTHYTIAPSRHAAEAVARIHGIPKGRIRVIPHGIDPRPYAPDAAAPGQVRQELNLGPEDILVLFAGRLDEAKGILDLYQAFRMASGEFMNLRLAIAGEGPLCESLRASLREDAMDDRVRLLGFREDLPSLYRAADIFALPSRREAFGMVLLEAMASSLPVVATRAGGIPEIVEDRRTGLLVPPADPPAMAAAMIDLARDRIMRTVLAAAGTASVIENFTLEAMARRTLDVYREAWSEA